MSIRKVKSGASTTIPTPAPRFRKPHFGNNWHHFGADLPGLDEPVRILAGHLVDRFTVLGEGLVFSPVEFAITDLVDSGGSHYGVPGELAHDLVESLEVLRLGRGHPSFPDTPQTAVSGLALPVAVEGGEI